MGRNIADFHGITISHDKSPSHMPLLVNATHPDHGIIGQLMLGYKMNNGSRKIRNIFVKPEFQRQGIATALWNYAVENNLKPQHSVDRTNEGDAWAKSLGVRLPKRR